MIKKFREISNGSPTVLSTGEANHMSRLRSKEVKRSFYHQRRFQP
jgi:hypothetical protein